MLFEVFLLFTGAISVLRRTHSPKSDIEHVRRSGNESLTSASAQEPVVPGGLASFLQAFGFGDFDSSPNAEAKVFSIQRANHTRRPDQAGEPSFCLQLPSTNKNGRGDPPLHLHALQHSPVFLG